MFPSAHLWWILLFQKGNMIFVTLSDIYFILIVKFPIRLSSVDFCNCVKIHSCRCFWKVATQERKQWLGKRKWNTNLSILYSWLRLTSAWAILQACDIDGCHVCIELSYGIFLLERAATSAALTQLKYVFIMMHVHVFYSSLSLLDNGLCHQNYQASQILPGRCAFFSAAFLHHWNYGDSLRAADGCGDQCHSS